MRIFTWKSHGSNTNIYIDDSRAGIMIVWNDRNISPILLWGVCVHCSVLLISTVPHFKTAVWQRNMSMSAICWSSLSAGHCLALSPAFSPVKINRSIRNVTNYLLMAGVPPMSSHIHCKKAHPRHTSTHECIYLQNV